MTFCLKKLENRKKICYNDNCENPKEGKLSLRERENVTL